MSDRHAEYEWQQQALQGRPRPIAPAPIRTPRPYPQTPRTGLRSTLAILAPSLVAAGLWLVLHAGPLADCVR